MTGVDQVKNEVRIKIWDLLEREHAVEPGVHGRIPAFEGADLAADKLAQLAVWNAAKVLKVVPDKPQLPVRLRALEENKLVYMAVPKLAEHKPFYKLDPAYLTTPLAQAASSRTARESASLVGVEEMRPVDLIVCGSVAVNTAGTRLGKGAGYSDIEVALLSQAGLIGPHTQIVTTVHSLQVVNQRLPETPHDFRVNLIVTPERIIDCGATRLPTALMWEDLDPAKIAAIPVLKKLLEEREGSEASEL